MCFADVICDVGESVAVGADWTLYGSHVYFGEREDQDGPSLS